LKRERRTPKVRPRFVFDFVINPSGTQSSRWVRAISAHFVLEIAMNRTPTSANQANSIASNAPKAQQPADYFDLHVKGCGYVSRIREVPVGRRGSETFLACAINALHGLCNDPSYSYFDLKVTGTEAAEVIRNLWQAVEEDRKVFVAFRAGDVYADPYEGKERNRETGELTGRTVLRASIKGRLLQITNAQIDGVVVFRSADEDPSGAAGASTPQADDAAATAAEESSQAGTDPNAAALRSQPQARVPRPARKTAAAYREPAMV
jgi:Protein of unknown function (DUF3577)